MVKQALQLLYGRCMYILGIVSRPWLVLSIDAHCRNQPRKTKLVLNKLLIHFNSYLKQMYINNKTEWFSYKVGVVYVGVHILVSRHLKEEIVFAKI